MVWTFLLLQYKHLSPYSGNSKGFLNYWTAGANFSTAFFLTCKRIAAETIPLIFKELPLLHEGAKILCPWTARESLKDRMMAKICQTFARRVIPKKIVSRSRELLRIPISVVNASFVSTIALIDSTKHGNTDLFSKDWDELLMLFPNLQSLIWRAQIGYEATTLNFRVLDLTSAIHIAIDPWLLILSIRERAYKHFIFHPRSTVQFIGLWANILWKLDELSNTNPEGMAEAERILDRRVLKGLGTAFAEKMIYLEAIEMKFSFTGVEAEDFKYHACTSPSCAAGDRRGCPM